MGTGRSTRTTTRHLAITGAAAAAVIAVAVIAPGGGGSVVAADAQLLADAPSGHAHLPGTPDHDHSDPATKNSVSRAAVTGEDTVDPTTAAERDDAEQFVAAERDLPDPELTTASFARERSSVPADRYEMAGGCYTVRAPDGRFLATTGTRVQLSDTPTPFRFQATDLGSYLLHTADGELAWAVVTSWAKLVAQPNPRADWALTPRGDGFVLAADGKELAVRGNRVVARPAGAVFRLRLAEGCDPFPEADVNVTGDPHAGVTPYQEVRGYVDAHTHGMAFEFLGGRVHCGRPWHRYGAPTALQDCPDHTATLGLGGVLESALSGEPYHDPVGWPTFKDWPAPNSLTHEGTYWKWLERAWRGGERLFVNLLVENNKLCQLYPLKKNSCDDMDSLRLQAQRMYELQDYVDAQYGGPGRGFYRIVTDPFEAREVINAGKLAVVMGIETSVPFGCTFKQVGGRDVAACDPADIDAQLDEMHDLGVRQMELVNKFDNALAGVAGDAGEVGVAVNAANFLETGTFWDMEHCEPADGESHDNPQLTLPDISAGQQDALFGAIGKVFGDVLPAVPLYQQPAHCNRRGLTDLGTHTIEALADRDMIFDPDHLSVKARATAMDTIEDLGHQGVISSHSWSTPDTYPRIYEAGGFITPYAGDAEGFVQKWRRHLGWADDRYYFGFGFGADINGLGAQGDPRGADVPNPVTYPFTGLGGVEIDRQTAGERTWDINVDGVAQYGLYPDWIEDLRRIADRQNGDGDAIVEDMTRGAEAYLQMWERATGIAPDSCRNPDRRLTPAAVRREVRPGMGTREVLQAVGQPHQRLGDAFEICAERGNGDEVRLRIAFDAGGNVVRVSR
ncbi:hypothetical protein KUV85_11530 [Nocardioides panacisoli]|uniref:hypothetical protein n=1 Tax=Nocardioides panacisoli TaxID=627624 RepID=UPI001C62C916|nr:hypothetical protein [Nocardioides panacisoli]QYJ02964.1 hypothetical protein KUV85_11530 [Nocardioides panacisoli]